MQRIGKYLLCVVLPVFAFVVAFFPLRASSVPQQNSAGEPVPAFHNQPPQGVLPPTMSPELFSYAVVKNAYAAAAHVKKVLYQQPCYCFCDRNEGHASLLDCFTSRHGSGCGTCLREALYTYEQTRKGKTAAQIREGIERGDWESLDLSKYLKPAIPSK